MASISSAIQKSVLSLLLARLPICLDEREEANISLSSGIYLTNLTLDEEKLEAQMPKHATFHVRSARLAQLRIQVGTDGIKAQVEGLHVVVSPKLGHHVEPDSVDEMVQSVIDLMDAVTVRGLASEAIDKEYKDDIEDEESAENEDLLKSMIESNTIPSDNKGSWTGYVLSYILGRVKVNLEDVRIKIMAELVALTIGIDSLEVETEKGERRCQLEGLRLGMLGTTREPTPPEPESDSEFDENLMASSFLAENKDQIQQSLLDSVNYKSGTMYTTTSSGGFFDAPSHLETFTDEMSLGPTLVFLGTASLVLSKENGIVVEIDTVRASLKRAPELASSLLGIVLQLNKSKTEIKTKETTSQTRFTLTDFNVGEVCVSLDSEISSAGKYEAPLSLCLLLNELSVQQKGDGFFQGSLMRLAMYEAELPIMSFQNERNTHVDIKFEIHSVGPVRTITVICPNNIEFDISMDQLRQMVELYSKFEPALDVISEINKPKRGFTNRQVGLEKHKSRSEVNVSLSGVHGKVKVKDGVLQLDSTGLSFNSLGQFDMGGLEVAFVNGTDNKVLRISELSMSNTPESVRGYDNNTKRQIKLRTKGLMKIGEITSTMPRSVLEILIVALREFQTLIPKKSKVQFKGNPPAHMTSSIMLRTELLDMYIILKKVKVNVLEIKQGFGGFELDVTNVCICMDLQGVINGFVDDFKICRVYDSQSQPFVHRANAADKSPMIMFKTGPGTPSVDIINWQVEYYGAWLKIFEEIGVDKYEDGTVTESPMAMRKKLSLELYVGIRDVAVGVNPVNLASRGVVLLKRACIDVGAYNDNTVVAQANVDSGEMYLVDDASNLRWGEPRLDLGRRLKTQGYVEVGNLQGLNARVSTSTRESIARMGGYGEKALVGVQMSIDDVELRVCSDSLQCLLALVKDAKPPVVFTDQDKYRREVEGIDVFEGVDPDMFGGRGGVTTHDVDREMSSDEESVNEISIVDDFYTKAGGKGGESKMGPTAPLTAIPLRIYLGLTKLRILLHDGYDWHETRLQISAAVSRVSTRAEEAQDEVVGEDLYSSIYVGMHSSGNRLDFVEAINGQIGSEAGVGRTTVEVGAKGPALHLKRSREHKVAIEVEGVEVDFMLMTANEPHLGSERPLTFEEWGSETVQKLSLGVRRFQVIDNVPTSNWHMFAGYLREAGEIEVGGEMVRVEMKMLRPVLRLAAMETILAVKVLPLRLHVDQDTLDFVLRFSQFKDERFDLEEKEEIYIGKFEMGAIPIKLDYKPKVVDYGGLRSGRAGEFVNLFVLDEARMTLKGVRMYALNGFGALNKALNGYWSPDITRNQLGGVLSGLAFARSLVDIGQGVEGFVRDPYVDYTREGRLVGGVQRGARKFGVATGGGMLKLGAKLAAGTQGVLEKAEKALIISGGAYEGTVDSASPNLDLDSDEDEEVDVLSTNSLSTQDRKTPPSRSLYSNQPRTFYAGLHEAYDALARNAHVVSDTVTSASARAARAETTSGAFGEALRATPVVALRPFIATSEAVSKTLLGGVNSLDPTHLARVEEKYKTK